MANRRYYPNKWNAINNLPDDFFEALAFEDVIYNIAEAWEMEEGIDTIIRATNFKTKKVSEYAYSSVAHAKNRLRKLCDSQCSEILVIRDEEMYLISRHGEDQVA